MYIHVHTLLVVHTNYISPHSNNRYLHCLAKLRTLLTVVFTTTGNYLTGGQNIDGCCRLLLDERCLVQPIQPASRGVMRRAWWYRLSQHGWSYSRYQSPLNSLCALRRSSRIHIRRWGASVARWSTYNSKSVESNPVMLDHHFPNHGNML